MKDNRTLFSLLLSNLFFTMLQPGIVAGLIPVLIVKDELHKSFDVSFAWVHYTGTAFFITGLIILLHCIIRFAVKGRGTLSPVDPATRLVVSGLYRYTRNPMYVGVMMMLCGEAIFFKSNCLWFYSIIAFAAFNAFIILYEEPRLRKTFGQEYEAYLNSTGRWF